MAEQERKLNVTEEELERIQIALKNEEFRKMFVEYAKEISDPENRKKYEQEIAQLEAERGMDVKFVNPQDGFVIKTSIKNEVGKKAFINICQSDAIGLASSNLVEKNLDGQSVPGQQWSIPYSLNQPRDDTDKAAKKCVVYDIVFHTKTYAMGQENPRFKKLIIDTTLDAIEEKWNVKLDRKNLKFPKLKFKGSKQATIIRNSNNKGTKEPGADIEIGNTKLPYPYKENPPLVNNSAQGESANASPRETGKSLTNHNVTPHYSIVHRGHLDLQNYTNSRDCRPSTRPQELVINIDLPLCESAAGIDLDVFEKQLILDSSDPLYHLDISLPYPVIEDDGGAQFDKSKRRLIVTLPVVPSPPAEPSKPVDGELSGPVSNIVSEDPLSSTNEISRPLNDHSEVPPNPGSAGIEEGTGSEDARTGLSDDIHSNEVNTEDDTVELKVDHEAVDDTADHINPGAAESEVNGIGLGTEKNAECVATEDMDVFSRIKEKSSGIACPFFNTPEYSYHQDSNSVTFVLHVSHVAIENVSLGFNENKCCISFPSCPTSPTSLTSPGYALYIQFPDDCIVDSDRSNIDSNDSNLVLVLYKDQNSIGLWDCFMIGAREDKLEKKLFLTETNLQKRLDETEDLWDGQSLITSHAIENASEELVSLRLEVDREKESKSSSMGNILTQVEELLGGEAKDVGENNPGSMLSDLLRASGVISSPEKSSVAEKDKLDQEDNTHNSCDGLDPELNDPNVVCAELDEVEVVEDASEDEEADECHNGLSTVHEVENPGGCKNLPGDIELQRARATKCKKNRRRRRRSTGSHESSSVSEEEGEPSAGKKNRGKHARRLRKTRSLSFGSSTESHDDVENGGQCNGQRCVRFNLVPEVHVFSNKSDKKKWKEIRRQRSLSEGDAGTVIVNPGKIKSSLKDTSGSRTDVVPVDTISPDTQSPEDEVFSVSAEGNVLKSSVTPNQVDSGVNDELDKKPQLTNTLIFDLDE